MRLVARYDNFLHVSRTYPKNCIKFVIYLHPLLIRSYIP